MNWLDKLYELAPASEETAIDHLFREANKLLENGEFEPWYGRIDLERLNVTLVVGVLSITLPDKDTSEERKLFVTRAEQYLFEHAGNERVDRLLRGLT